MRTNCWFSSSLKISEILKFKMQYLEPNPSLPKFEPAKEIFLDNYGGPVDAFCVLVDDTDCVLVDDTDEVY